LLKGLFSCRYKKIFCFYLQSMKLLQSPKAVPLAALILVVLVIADLFVIPKREVVEVVDNGTIETSRTSVTRSHESYLLIAKSKKRYLVPQNIFNTILVDQEFVAHKTRLFNRFAQISWCEGNGCYIQDTGTFNTVSISYLLLGGIALVSLLSALGVLKLKTVQNYILLGLAGGVFICHLFF
jgi:hypothetical protein